MLEIIITTIVTTFASGITGAIVAWIVARPERMKVQQDEIKAEQAVADERLRNIEEGVQASLRDKLQTLYLRVQKRGKKCLPYEKENASYLFKAYERLGGNSYIHELFQQIMEAEVLVDYLEVENEIK